MEINKAYYSKYKLCQEMYQTVDVIRDFDSNAPSCPPVPAGSRKVFITGEGSSRMIPAKNIIEKNMRAGAPLSIFTEGACQASEYLLDDMIIIGLSNSGKTRELLELYNSLLERNHGQLWAITAGRDTILEKKAQFTHTLSCGKEEAVAASKSVVEQSLAIEHIYSRITGIPMADKSKLAEAFKYVLDMDIPKELVEKLAAADTIYFAGRNNGIAEELTLKTNEIARKKSDFLEGTYGVHGIEEVMQKNEVVIILDPFPGEEKKYKEVFVDTIGMTVISIAPRDTLFETIRIPQLPAYSNYIQLAAGWNILIELALAAGIDPDKPERARKVGNEYFESSIK